MKRQLCATALFALALVPDWASACWPRGGRPAPEVVYYAPPCTRPVYRAPICYPHTPVTVVPAAPPMAVPAPRVESVKPKGGPVIEQARPIAQPNPLPPKAQPEAVRPAAGAEAPKSPRPAPRVEAPQPPTPIAKPEPAPAPAEPKRGGLFDIPKPPEPKAEEKIPPRNVPMAPGAEPKLPPLVLPNPEAPKLPPLDMPAAPAIPSPAPAPVVPTPSAAAPQSPDALPPLTLPPDTPVTPITPERPVESKSSPLTGAARELKVSVFPAAGSTAGNGLRKVGFYNHTPRDLSLTIEGKAVTLPAMSYLHAQVPSVFTWKCGDKPAAKETIPADAAGVDVLIRE